MTSIAAVANFYNEANAMSGWLESASQWADEIVLVNAGPGGKHSDDGSLEICEKWGADVRFDRIDDGFGVLRTKLITISKCDWVVILDIDERLYRFAPILKNEATGMTYYAGAYDQIAILREICAQPWDAVVTSRRHWHDFSWTRPTQDYCVIKDWQARIVRNCEHIVYRADVKMHEKIIDTRTGSHPNWAHPEFGQPTIFHDHYHMLFKSFEPEQRAHDVAIYDSLERGEKPPTYEEFTSK